MSPGSIASGVAAETLIARAGPPSGWNAAAVSAEAPERAQFHRSALGVESRAMHRIGRRLDPERVLARLAVGEIERQALIERSVLDGRRDEGARAVDFAHSHSDYIGGVEAVRNGLDDLVGLRIALIRHDRSEAEPDGRYILRIDAGALETVDDGGRYPGIFDGGVIGVRTVGDHIQEHDGDVGPDVLGSDADDGHRRGRCRTMVLSPDRGSPDEAGEHQRL